MPEPLGVLLLPAKLEQFELAAHARDLLDIPRVVAVEPGRWHGRGWFAGEVRANRQARRLRFPGHPALLVLYHPAQYPLARSLAAKHDAELWYVRSGGELSGAVRSARPGAVRSGAELYARSGAERSGAEAEPQLEMLDELARDRAVRIVPPDATAEIRQRLRELEIISHRPFAPGGRLVRR